MRKLTSIQFKRSSKALHKRFCFLIDEYIEAIMLQGIRKFYPNSLQKLNSIFTFVKHNYIQDFHLALIVKLLNFELTFQDSQLSPVIAPNSD